MSKVTVDCNFSPAYSDERQLFFLLFPKKIFDAQWIVTTSGLFTSNNNHLCTHNWG